jgi:hypothetical protein
MPLVDMKNAIKKPGMVPTIAGVPATDAEKERRLHSIGRDDD